MTRRGGSALRERLSKKMSRLHRKQAGKVRARPHEEPTEVPRWYTVEAYFDPSLIEPVDGFQKAFMFGFLRDYLVVEVPEREQVTPTGEGLQAMGITALVVTPNIKYFRLRLATPDEVATLERHEEPENVEHAVPDGAAVPDDAGV